MAFANCAKFIEKINVHYNCLVFMILGSMSLLGFLMAVVGGTVLFYSFEGEIHPDKPRWQLGVAFTVIGTVSVVIAVPSILILRCCGPKEINYRCRATEISTLKHRDKRAKAHAKRKAERAKAAKQAAESAAKLAAKSAAETKMPIDTTVEAPCVPNDTDEVFETEEEEQRRPLTIRQENEYESESKESTEGSARNTKEVLAVDVHIPDKDLETA